MQSLKTLKPFEVTLPLTKQTSNLCYWSVYKKRKLENLQTAKQSFFFSKSVKKSVKRAVGVLRAQSARVSFSVAPQVSLSVFSLVPDLLFDCSRVHEYAKIRTVLQSRESLFFRTVRRQLFTHTLLHHSSTTPYSLFTFLIHSARQFACEQALLLVDSREVTREPHAKGDVSARVESSLAGYTTVRYFLFTRPIQLRSSESHCFHLSPQSFNFTCFVFSPHFIIFLHHFFWNRLSHLCVFIVKNVF